MATSLEDFSYFFWPLIILGAWCLFEEIAMICNKKSWPLLYRWAEVPWIMEGAEEFLKTPEGAKMLKIHMVEEEQEQDENEQGSVLELKEATDGKSETMDEEKEAEN